MTDIVERLRDQCCHLGHDDHGHTNCWLFGRAAAEIERLREENTTLRERTTPFEGDKSYSGDDDHKAAGSDTIAALIEHAYLGESPC